MYKEGSNVVAVHKHNTRERLDSEKGQYYLVYLTFSGDDGLEAGWEEIVELEVVYLGAEVPDPDRVVLLARQDTVGVVV